MNLLRTNQSNTCRWTIGGQKGPLYEENTYKKSKYKNSGERVTINDVVKIYTFIKRGIHQWNIVVHRPPVETNIRNVYGFELHNFGLKNKTQKRLLKLFHLSTCSTI